MSPHIEVARICAPSWTERDLWRWMMLAFAVICMGHGLFGRNVRMRDSRTFEGWLKGKVVTGWKAIYMRILFVLIGIAAIIFAFSFNCQLG